MDDGHQMVNKINHSNHSNLLSRITWPKTDVYGNQSEKIFLDLFWQGKWHFLHLFASISIDKFW